MARINTNANAGAALLAVILLAGDGLRAEEAVNTRTQTFDRDPGWDGHNNRAKNPKPMKVKQDFGYSPTAHAGGKTGEIGGFMTPAAEPSFYAKVTPDQTFENTLTASGKFRIAKGGGHILITFFNRETANEL